MKLCLKYETEPKSSLHVRFEMKRALSQVVSCAAAHPPTDMKILIMTVCSSRSLVSPSSSQHAESIDSSPQFGGNQKQLVISEEQLLFAAGADNTEERMDRLATVDSGASSKGELRKTLATSGGISSETLWAAIAATPTADSEFSALSCAAPSSHRNLIMTVVVKITSFSTFILTEFTGNRILSLRKFITLFIPSSAASSTSMLLPLLLSVSSSLTLTSITDAFSSSADEGLTDFESDEVELALVGLHDADSNFEHKALRVGNGSHLETSRGIENEIFRKTSRLPDHFQCFGIILKHHEKCRVHRFQSQLEESEALVISEEQLLLLPGGTIAEGEDGPSLLHRQRSFENLAIQGVAIATEWMDEMVPCFLRMSINPCQIARKAIIKGDRVSTCKLRHVVVSALGPQFMIPYWLLLYVISGVFTCFPTFHHGI
nr:hypothetical protein Iba_chr03bCG9590 [Ipomoea batatas]